jgi:DNA polymerase-1
MAERKATAGKTGERIVLIDGHALLFRAFHALQPLTSPRGEPVNAVYGFVLMLIKALELLKPRYMVAAFDTSRQTFRSEQFEAYKAQRGEAPAEFRPQLAHVLDLLGAMRVPVFRQEGFEADDLLGTLSCQAAEQGLDAIILTGDTDALQLVGPHVRVLTSRKGFSDTVLYDEAAVEERYGLQPRQLIDFKALRGDSSDNIPGIPGVGDKTASKLLASFGSVESIYEHLDELPEKQRALLAPHAEQVALAKRLTTIVCDMDVALDLEAAELSHYDAEALRTQLYDLGFRSLVDRLPAVLAASAAAADGSHKASSTNGQLGLFGDDPTAPALDGTELVDTPEAVSSLAERLRGASALAVDVASSSANAVQADLVGLSLAPAEGHASYVPIGHAEGHNLPSNGDAPLGALQPLLSDESPLKYAHNAKGALMLLGRNGVELRGLAFDTMIAAYLLDPATRSPEIRDLVWKHFQEQLPTATQLTGTGRNARSLADLPVEQVGELFRAQAEAVARLVPRLEAELERCGQMELFHQIELPLVPVLADIELVGVAVDVEYLKQLSRELHERLQDLEREIYAQVGHEFSINAPKQLASVLFDELHLPRGKRTSTGQASTGANVLESLRGAHPVVGLILDHRQLAKLKSTYVDALPLLVNPRTGRVHTSFNQTIAATGRLSSSDPNLQNIPIRTDLGRRVRRAFIPGQPGCVLLSADYSQIELRILAHETGDPKLVEAFQEGEDIHARTAAEVMGVELDQVTPDMRRFAKVVNFGLIYGMSEYGLASRAELPAEVANTFIQRYFERFGTVKQYQDRLIEEARRKGYVETMFKRRRYTPDLNSPIYNVRQAAMRQAINHPIQGTASDIMKIAMIRVHDLIRERGWKASILLQVHDELVFELPESEVGVFADEVRRTMSEAVELKVPLDVEVKAGTNWEEMSPLVHA